MLIALCAVLKAGYELWSEAEEARKKAQAQLRNADQDREKLDARLREVEQERAKLEKELGVAQSSMGASAPSGAEQVSSLATINRLTDEKAELKKELQKYKNNVWWREGVHRKLKAERDELREEKRRDLQNEPRKHIEVWRSVIQNFDFNTANQFSGTDTYSQMRPHLQDEAVKMLEASRIAYVAPEGRGGDLFRYTLLDEVARIEREWDLV